MFDNVPGAQHCSLNDDFIQLFSAMMIQDQLTDQDKWGMLVALLSNAEFDVNAAPYVADLLNSILTFGAETTVEQIKSAMGERLIGDITEFLNDQSE